MGFSSDWLTLREPADRAARDTPLLQRALALAGSDPVVMDLGCGTGSTVRTLAPALPPHTSWRLVDNDPELLAQAAEAAGPHSSSHLVDIDRLDQLPLAGVTLVTASALLDLVTEDWLVRFAAILTVPFYAALSYNGQMHWSPADPRDEWITEAFNRHQRIDKGLGPALGPTSVQRTIEVFEAAGFHVVHAESPWRVGPDSEELQRAHVAGIAEAAAEAPAEAGAEAGAEGKAESARAWGETRMAQARHTESVTGHGDLLIIPPSATEPVVS